MPTGRWLTPEPDKPDARTMTKEFSARIMLVLSVLYGITCGLLGAFDVAVGPFALVGGVVLGLLWIARALFIQRPAARKSG